MKVLLMVCLFSRFLPALLLAAPRVIIDDDFDDNSRNPYLWQPLIIGNGYASEINGRLETTVQSSTSSTTTLAGFSIRGTIAGDFDVRIDYQLLLPLPLVDTEPGVVIGLGSLPDPLFVGRYIDNDTLLNQYIADVGDGEYGISTSDNSGRLRFTRVGNMMSAYYWNFSAGDWQLIRSATTVVGPISLLAIGVVIDGPGTVSAALDNFHLE